MRLLFKQRFFSWFDRYDIYYEDGSTAFTVEGKLSWGHKLHIIDAQNRHIATVQEKIFHFLPVFEFYINGVFIGTLRKRFHVFQHVYDLDGNGWRVQGNFPGWNYEIVNASGALIANISKELFHFTDTYEIDTPDAKDALLALMITLAIDAEKCSQS